MRRACAGLVCATSFLLSVTGCYRGPGTDNPENVRGAPMVPWGVILTPEERMRPKVRGLHLGREHYACCGVDKRVDLRVAADGRPQHLYLKFYTPDFSRFTGRPMRDQTLEVIFSPRHHRTFGPFHPDKVNFVTVGIPSDAHIKSGILAVTLNMGFATVVGNDPRPYSVILIEAETGA